MGSLPAAIDPRLEQGGLRSRMMKLVKKYLTEMMLTTMKKKAVVKLMQEDAMMVKQRMTTLIEGRWVTLEQSLPIEVSEGFDRRGRR